MAKKKEKPKFPQPRDASEALHKLERPAVRWQVIGLVAFALVVLWALASGLIPYIGWWGVVGMSAVTVGVIGFGLYAWRLTRRSQAVVDILKGATDEEGRRQAMEKLASAKDSDAMAKLAHAQLVSRENPAEAMGILEGIDLEKAPAMIADDVRANLTLLYLMHGRTREARELADVIKVDRQAQAKGKALYAACVAEAFARTGSAAEAKQLLETYDASDPEFAEVAALLYRAQVYTYMGTKNRGLAKKALEHLARVEPNMLAAFLVKGVRPDLQKLARQVVQGAGVVPKQKMRVQRR